VASCFTTDESESSFNIEQIIDKFTFPQRGLSSTAYCLTRAKAWDGLRFCEEGPFSEPGWGVDDNEMAYRWNDVGIVHHDWTEAMGIYLYRRASGSFARLHKETGIWPSQYGSVFEKRNVWCAQNYLDHRMLFGWPREIKTSYIFEGLEYPELARKIKAIHDQGKEANEIIVMTDGLNDETLDWIETHRLRWHWGDTAITPGGDIVRRNEDPDTWTGDFLIDADPRGAPVIMAGEHVK